MCLYTVHNALINYTRITQRQADTTLQLISVNSRLEHVKNGARCLAHALGMAHVIDQVVGA
jgi:hypothetical protein